MPIPQTVYEISSRMWELPIYYGIYDDFAVLFFEGLDTGDFSRLMDAFPLP